MVSTFVFVGLVQHLIWNIFRLESVTWRTSWSCTDRVQSEFADVCCCSSQWQVGKSWTQHRLNTCLLCTITHTQYGKWTCQKSGNSVQFVFERKTLGMSKNFFVWFYALPAAAGTIATHAGSSVRVRVPERLCFDSRRATMPLVPLQHQTLTPALSFKFILHRHLLRFHQQFQSQIRQLLSFAS